MIQILKYFFLGMAIVVIVGLFIWERDAGQIKLAAVNMAIDGEITADSVEATNMTTTLEQPRYQGRDNNGQQWLLSADRALQQGSLNEGRITLINTTAQFMNPNNETDLLFSAGRGLYTRPSADTSETLTLSDNVTVTGYGMELQTEELIANIVTRDISAPSPIKLVGTLGGLNLDLTAGGFQYAQGTSAADEILELTGGLRARLTPTSSATNSNQ